MAEFASPPDPNFTGIDFNPNFFPSTSSEYVEYPVAQGTVTFGDIFATDIDTPTPSVDFDLLSSELGNINIGTSVSSANIIQIGPSSNTSVHCGSIDLNGTDINNAVNASAGDLSIGNLQTTGVLNLGTGLRTIGSNGGGINIGTLATGTIPITIGTTGKSTIILNGTSVKIGTKIISTAYDATASGTSMTVGSNLTNGSLTIGGKQSGDISLGDEQTSGDLFIGSGERTAAGDINIGTGANAACNLYIGHKATTVSTQVVKINTSTGVGVGATTIGSTTSATNIAGALNVTGMLTADGGLTLNAGDLLTATGGIKSNSLDVTSSSSEFNIGASQSSGLLNIGNTARTTAGGIYIGTGSGVIANPIYIGGGATVTTVGNTLAVTGNLTANGGITLPSGDTLTVSGTISGTGNISTTGTLSAGVGILSGSIGYESTSATTYTIPNITNRDYYLLVLLASGTCVVTMPTLKTNQIVHIRSYNAAGTAITVKVPTSTSGSFYPSGMSTSFASQWTAFPAGTTQNFYCTGADWVGF